MDQYVYLTPQDIKVQAIIAIPLLVGVIIHVIWPPLLGPHPLGHIDHDGSCSLDMINKHCGTCYADPYSSYFIQKHNTALLFTSKQCRQYVSQHSYCRKGYLYDVCDESRDVLPDLDDPPTKVYNFLFIHSFLPYHVVIHLYKVRKLNVEFQDGSYFYKCQYFQTTAIDQKPSKWWQNETGIYLILSIAMFIVISTICLVPLKYFYEKRFADCASVCIDFGGSEFGYCYMVRVCRQARFVQKEYRMPSCSLEKQRALFYVTSEGRCYYGVKAVQCIHEQADIRTTPGTGGRITLQEALTDVTSFSAQYLSAKIKSISLKHIRPREITTNRCKLTIVHSKAMSPPETPFQGFELFSQVTFMQDIDAAALGIFNYHGSSKLKKNKMYMVVSVGGTRCTFAECRGGKCFSKPVPVMDIGGNDVDAALCDVISSVIGSELIDEYKSHHPVGWIKIQTLLQDLKKVDNRNSQLELGDLGHWLDSKGSRDTRTPAFRYLRDSSGRLVSLQVPLSAMKNAYDVITNSPFMLDVSRHIAQTPGLVYLVGGLTSSGFIKDAVARCISVTERRKRFLSPDFLTQSMRGGALASFNN